MKVHTRADSVIESFRHFVDVRPGERRAALQAFLCLAGLIGAMSILQTARDALFLMRLGPEGLPVLDLAIGGIALLLAQLPGRGPIGSRGRLLRFLVLAALGAMGLWAWFPTAPEIAAPVLYIATSLFGIYATFKFWLVASTRFTLAQAQRLYGPIGAGAVVGAVSGSSLAAVLATIMPARHLIVVGVGVMVLTMAAVTLWSGDRQAIRAGPAHDTMVQRSARSARHLLGHRYVRSLVFLMAMAGLVLSAGDYWFKATIAAAVDDSRLATAFGTVYAVGSAVGLVLQLGFTGWLLRKMGAPRSLMLLPLLIAVSVGMSMGGLVLLGAAAVKTADLSLRHTQMRSALEIMLLPIRGNEREGVKRLLELDVYRVAQAVAAALVLALLHLGNGDLLFILETVLLVGIAGWLVAAWHTRRGYLRAFRHSLAHPGGLDLDRARMDRAGRQGLYRALRSDDPMVVRLALRLVERKRRYKLVPPSLLDHDDPEIVERALPLLLAARRRGLGPRLQEMTRDPRPGLAAAAQTALGWLNVDAGRSDPARREARREVLPRAPALPPTPEERLSLVRQLIHQSIDPDPGSDATLVALCQDAVPEVRAEAARAMGARGSSRFVPHLLTLLADHRTRSRARDAIVAIGSPALPHLVRALRDPALPHEIRLHIPRTLARFDGQRVGPILMRQVALERDGSVQYKILRALGELRRDVSFLGRNSPAVHRAMRLALASAGRMEHRRRKLAAGAEHNPNVRTPPHFLLLDLLCAKRDNTLERILRLLDLDRPWLGLLRLLPAARDPNRRASLGTMLGEALPLDLAESLRWLFDPDAPISGERWVGHYLQTEPSEYVEVLRVLAEDESTSLRHVALAQLHELHDPRGRPDLPYSDEEPRRTVPPRALLQDVQAWIDRGPRRLPV